MRLRVDIPGREVREGHEREEQDCIIYIYMKLSNNLILKRKEECLASFQLVDYEMGRGGG